MLSSGVLDTSSERRLKAVYRALDPVRLLNQVESLQEALWRHALFQSRGRSPIADLVAQFDLSACGGDDVEQVAIASLPRPLRVAVDAGAPEAYSTPNDAGSIHNVPERVWTCRSAPAELG